MGWGSSAPRLHQLRQNISLASRVNKSTVRCPQALISTLSNVIQYLQLIMANILPPIPRTVFTVLEPISLLAGFLAPILNTSHFVSTQLPATSPNLAAYGITPTDRVLALQLGNVYGLIGMIGIGVLYATNEPKVVRNYMVACAIADIGHLWVTCAVMGFNDFCDVLGWNEMAWGNIGVTAMLFASRMLYLVGAFGEDRIAKVSRQDAKDTGTKDN